jgi:hypothetical protein
LKENDLGPTATDDLSQVLETRIILRKQRDARILTAARSKLQRARRAKRRYTHTRHERSFWYTLEGACQFGALEAPMYELVPVNENFDRWIILRES